MNFPYLPEEIRREFKLSDLKLVKPKSSVKDEESPSQTNG